MIPTSLSIISCEEHDRLTAQDRSGAKMMPGGAWGKASYCPKDAAEAQLIWQQARDMANKQPQQGN